MRDDIKFLFRQAWVPVFVTVAALLFLGAVRSDDFWSFLPFLFVGAATVFNTMTAFNVGQTWVHRQNIKQIQRERAREWARRGWSN